MFELDIDKKYKKLFMSLIPEHLYLKTYEKKSGKIRITLESYLNEEHEQTLFDLGYKIGINEAEKQRIKGVLLGLSIAKKAWDKNLGRNEIYENEIIYQEELAKLS